jgi:hypothetical protein
MDVGFIGLLYTPLGTTLYRSLTHTDYCPKSITVFTSRFLAVSSASRSHALFVTAARAELVVS